MTTSTLERAAPVPIRTADVRVALLFLLVGIPLMIVAYQTPWLHPALWLIVLLVATRLLLRRDGLSMGTLGLDIAWRRLGEFLGGFAGGTLLVAAGALCLWLLLPFPWARNPTFAPHVAMASLYYLFLVNTAEELVFRGYSFVALMRRYGHWPAQVTIALLFALFHIACGQHWVSALITTTTGSLLFALVLLRWRSLPAAAGVHLAANWVRDLLLLDPAGPKTLYAPTSPRPWAQAEQLTSMLTLTGLTVVVCVALALSVRRRRSTTW